MANSSQFSLRGIALLASLSDEDLKAVERKCQWRRYGPGEQVIGYLDETTDVYFIVAGSVRAIIYSASGREVMFRDIGEGDVAGDLAALTGKPRSATILSLTDSALASISSRAFEDLLLSDPNIAVQMAKRLAVQMQIMSERIHEFSSLAVRYRIYAELLRMAGSPQPGDGAVMIRPFPTHAELASRVSTHREAVSRELSGLVRSGVIERRGDSLIVLDFPRLSRMVDDARGKC